MTPFFPTLLMMGASVLTAPAAITATGVVVDATTGLPLAGALVQQQGALASAFTAPDGRFRFVLEPGPSAVLSVSAQGYEDLQVRLTGSQPARIGLHAIATFLPAAPLSPQLTIGASAGETAPLGSGLRFAYALRTSSLAAATASGTNATLAGLSNNDFRLGLRFRWRPVLAEFEGAHFEQPVNVAGLRTQDNPAYNASTWQTGVRAGWLWAVSRDSEVSPMLGFWWSNTVPNNNHIPYTGSGLDFEQTRRAVGPVILAAWRPGRGRWHLEAGAGYYPWVAASAVSPGQTYAADSLTTVHGLLGYEVVQGLRLGLGVDLEQWAGAGQDTATRYTVGLHYLPGGVPGVAE